MGSQKGVLKSPEHIRKIREAHLKRNLWKKGICRTCYVHITPEEADKSRLARNQWVCISCERERGRLKNKTLKTMVFEQYGSKCACCGEMYLEFLNLHHINNDGAAHRREIGRHPSILRRLLRDTGFPKDNYQLLCFNCNCALAFFGYCPHTNK